MVGVVKWYREDACYGFVIAEDKDYFFHASDVLPKGTHLAEGLHVEFEPAIGPRGLRAHKVRIIVPVRRVSGAGP